MPAATNRKVDEHFEATELIPSDQFIPRFLSADAQKKVKARGTVGLRGFQCKDYAKFSPYLMMSDITVGPPLMFPDHPHCGHEMMMYVLHGEFTHEDFMGFKETFGPGDLHWMTTGKGIIHAQVPGKEAINRHVQFWINLPKTHKHIAPANQVLKASKTPVVTEGDAQLRLLVGKYGGKEAPIKTVTPLLMMDVKVAPNKVSNLKLPCDFSVGTYVLEGKGHIGGTAIKKNSVTLSKISTTGGESVLEIKAGSEPLCFLLFAGAPINEPVEADGFFVCCTKEETKQAVTDFDQRTNSYAAGKTWSSKIAN